MQNFADQCLDLARSTLGQNLEPINEDGTITPFGHEHSRIDEPGHAALAIGEYYRAAQEVELHGYDLIDLVARCITAQVFDGTEGENGLAYSALGLLSFGPSKDRNMVWERLLEETQEMLDSRLLARSDYDNHFQSFNIAKAVTRYSMGLSKKDETGKLIDRFVDRIKEISSAGYCDDHPHGMGGCYDIYGVLSFVFIRQALQLHANIHLRDRKLPSLRTHAEKYLKMLPDIVRHDGMGWCYGRGIGAYGQMHIISLTLQGLRDGWIEPQKQPIYMDILRRAFQFFYVTYLDQEQGYLVIRDQERDTYHNHTTRMANYDAARYLCQWARLARSINADMSQAKLSTQKTTSRFIVFDKSNKKEQGLFIYRDQESGLNVQIPLVSSGDEHTSDSLSFPHCQGIFDWPVNRYLPIMLPELTIGDKKVIPAYYGKNCVVRMTRPGTYEFSYQQPEWITTEEETLSGYGECKVKWVFQKDKITSEFCFSVKNQLQIKSMRYMLAIAAPHSNYYLGTSFRLGEESHRCVIHKDDFQANWQDLQDVSENPNYKTYTGKIHYLQILSRDYPLVMRPGQQYRLQVAFQPDIALIDE